MNLSEKETGVKHICTHTSTNKFRYQQIICKTVLAVSLLYYYKMFDDFLANVVKSCDLTFSLKEFTHYTV